MFSFFAAAVAVYASKTLSDAAVSTPVLSEEKPLLSKHTEIIEPLPQLTEDAPFINQITKLLDIKKFNIAYKIIKHELKRENDFQNLGKIIQLIDQIKQQVSEHHKWDGLSLFGQPPIISELNTLRQQAVTARIEQVALSHTHPIPPLAPIPTLRLGSLPHTALLKDRPNGLEWALFNF